jgi:hypothetical protein
MTLVNANTAEHTKRITTNAMYIIGAGLGSFIGPFFFKTNQEPYYPLGFDFMFVAFSLEVLVLVSLLRSCGRGIERGGLREGIRKEIFGLGARMASWIRQI